MQNAVDRRDVRYQAAKRDELLPRKPLPKPQPAAATPGTPTPAARPTTTPTAGAR